jgi:hypothetical protein
MQKYDSYPTLVIHIINVLRVCDDTGDHIHIMDNDAPNVIGQSLLAFNFFTLHFRILPDHVDYVLRKDYPMEDDKWWHDMSPDSGRNDTFIRQYQSDYVHYLPIKNLLEQNVVLHSTPGFRPESPLIDPNRPPGKFVESRVWLVYAPMEIQEFPKSSHSFTTITAAVLQDLTRVADLEKKSVYGPVE